MSNYGDGVFMIGGSISFSDVFSGSFYFNGVYFEDAEVNLVCSNCGLETNLGDCKIDTENDIRYSCARCEHALVSMNPEYKEKTKFPDGVTKENFITRLRVQLNVKGQLFGPFGDFNSI